MGPEPNQGGSREESQVSSEARPPALDAVRHWADANQRNTSWWTEDRHRLVFDVRSGDHVGPAVASATDRLLIIEVLHLDELPDQPYRETALARLCDVNFRSSMTRLTVDLATSEIRAKLSTLIYDDFLNDELVGSLIADLEWTTNAWAESMAELVGAVNGLARPSGDTEHESEADA